jgi:hypothetical protein
MAITFPERVAERAQSVNVVKLVLSVLAFPFYVLGFVAGVLWLVVRWVYAAVAVGFADGLQRRGGG